jgi:rhodanese-related sulfurtransferase
MRFIIATLVFLAASLPALAFEQLSPPEAHEQVKNGKAILIDIRRPDEWDATGVATGARRIDMRRDDFMSEIKAIAAANPGKKIALICQAGVRSARMSNALERAGLSNIIDVTGGTAEWIELGLPVKR